ncbi:MAG: bifunctional oligoribonuclease/PAP phosphatase NrnA [Treponema sp.]|nr:bifunctional oligoribonuclease/PAP phosphatase NrnA [Treponema sp.]
MNTITAEQIASFKDFIDANEFFYIIGHKEPDGDCIASCLGFKAIVEACGKSCQLLSAGPFKRIEIQQYQTLFSKEMEFLTEEERKKTGLLICDCSEFHRLGEIDGDVKNLATFIVDHHKTAQCPEGAKCIVDPSAPAASVLVQLLYEKCIGTVPTELAKILFFGIMTDTGFFKFLSPADADVIVAVSRLVEAGADPRATYDAITSGKPYNTRKLLGVLLDHAKRYIDGKLVITYEAMEDTKKYGQEGRDSDLLYSSMLSAKGVQAVVFVRQETDSNCTIGLRSIGDIDVSAIASKFGGGGHKNASGASVPGRINTLIPTILKEFARVM